MKFPFPFRERRRLGLDLGAQAAELGFGFDSSATVSFNSSMNLDLTFGVDLTAGLEARPNAFYINLNGLSFAGSINATNLNASAHLGLMGLSVANGSLNLSGQVSIAPTGLASNVTMTTFSKTPAAALMTPTASGTMSASLPLTGSLGTYTVPGGVSLSATDSNIFGITPPQVTASGLGDLPDFNNVSPANILSDLSSLATFLDSLRKSSLLTMPIPFTGQTLGGILDLKSALNNGLIKALTSGNGSLRCSRRAQSLSLPIRWRAGPGAADGND